MDIFSKKLMKSVTITPVDPTFASEMCHVITATLPEWFGIPEANAKYEHGMLDKKSFIARLNDDCVGMITLEFPYPHNANIFWMAVKKPHHRKKIGTKLLNAAENYCLQHGYSTLTVETLSPKQHDVNYLSTFLFYEKSGFKPLFELYSHGPDHLMVYLQKLISLDDFIFIDLTHSLSTTVPHWGLDVGFKYNARMIESAEAEGVKFRVQRLEMSSGIGTHMDAPSHCYEKLASINHIPIQSLITLCRVIDVSDKAHENYSITPQDINLFEEKFGMVPKDAFVIIYTGWDKRWAQPEKYRNEKIFPNISLEAAKLLLARDIVGLGIDTLSPDVFGSDFPVHQLMLGAGKYIVENVANANQLNPVGCYTFALPIKIEDGTEAPMRLIGMKRKL